MTDRQITHAPGCWGWGPKHYECAVREIERLAAQLAAETSSARGEVEYEYEVWQDGVLQAGGREADYASAQSEANHYAMMYAQDGPVEVRIYEKRLLSTTQQYGVPPERDAQPPADDEVVFYDGVGAGRSSVKSCRDGVQWIRVGNRVYWPLSDSDAKRLHSACCGNGSFDGPTTPADDALADRLDRYANAAAELTAEIERLRAEVERLNRILGRIVEGDGDSTVSIRAGADAFAAAREYLLRDQEEGK